MQVASTMHAPQHEIITAFSIWNLPRHRVWTSNLELCGMHIYIILVQIALKHELGLLPILRYETRVILYAHIVRTLRTIATNLRERNWRRVTTFAIRVIAWTIIAIKIETRLSYFLLTCVKSEIYFRWLIFQPMHWSWIYGTFACHEPTDPFISSIIIWIPST